ncbi:MAG: oligoendopeptidase F [Clostridiales bacterium]|nr:oligoendopeptidase F [Clostridiales bacterium]MDD7310705.1 oligoendopeptidase F [Eubacteriales bacterium]MDY5347311.1 oligoendopeptidase F [Eubacteriales bacterium]
MSEPNKTKKIPKRSEVDPKNTWATEDLFANDEAWEQAMAELASMPEQMASFRGRLGESGACLLDYFRLSDTYSLKISRAANYAFRKADEDTAVGRYQEMRGKIISLDVAVSSASAFDTPEILAIPDETLERFYRETPDLQLYRRALDKIRARRAHVLSDAEEKLLASAGEMAESPEQIGSMFRDADLKFPEAVDANGEKHQLTQGSYIPMLQSADRVLRKSAFETLYHTFGSFKNTTAACLDAQMKQLIFFARARKYDSALDASLARTEVPVSVYTNLIQTVSDNLPYMYRYVRLRKKLMGLDELHMYDIYTTLVSDAEREITFEQAKQTVLEGLAPLGAEYRAMLEEGFANRWIDVYENEGKRSGAYSSGALPHPYVLLNHQNTLDSQFTLAHEMGHALHSYLSLKNQPTVYSDYVIFVAEVASTCNEVLLMRHLLSKTTDKRERAYLINYFLEQFRGTLYRQTMFAEFELMMSRRAEAGQALTADALCEMYYDLNKKYYGEDVVVDREIAMEWARIPHFFYNFYVFQYATGFSAAVAIANRILREGQPAVDDYLKFLSSGSTMDPISLLKIAGVDMASPAPINDALKIFDDLISEMEALCAE